MVPVFDEAAAAGPEHLGSAAAGYDRKAQFDPRDEIVLLRRLGLDADSTLIDFGAGTGTLAIAAAACCRKVIAVDVSPAMLAALREKVTAADVENVEAVEAGFLTYEHAGAPVDFVFSRNALHHLPDFWKTRAVARLASVLKDGGVLRLVDLVFSFDPAESDSVLEAWIGDAPESGDGWTRGDLERHVRDEYSTFTWLLEPMLDRVGLEITDRAYSDSRIFAAYTCVKRG